MTLRALPKAKALQKPKGLDWDPPSDVLARWAELPRAAEADDPATISIYDVIGEDPWSGGGVTARRIAAALRSIGKKDVTVNINSPGGDFFEGLAIYNLLVEHPAEVAVKVMGMAASAASIVAMAGDSVAMARGSFLFVHNTWALAIGNRHDMRQAADALEQFDGALSEIYQARSGLDAKAVGALLDAESWLNAQESVKQGFADEVSGAAPAAEDGKASDAVAAKRRIDAILAQHGVPRSERRRLYGELTGGKHNAAPHATPSAGPELAALRSLIDTIQT